MKDFISAYSFARLPDGEPPKDIVYIPEGEHTITPLVNGKAKTITVKMPAARGVEIAAMMQGELEKLLGQNVRPVLDFDHKRSGPASALPTAFSYRPGVGLILAVDWTNAGSTAISGKDYSYFSPDFLLNEDGTPGGLPERGPVGTLCNHPAFREIPRIAASDAAPDSEPTPNSKMKLIAAHLKLDDSRTDLESLVLARITAMEGDAAGLPAKIAELEKELADAKAKLKEQSDVRASDLVTAAIADGRIAPKDDKSQAFYKRHIAAGDAEIVDMLAALPKLNGHLDRPIIKANEQRPGATGDHAFTTKAKALVAAKEATTLDEAYGIVAAKEPDVYEDYQSSLG